MACSIVVLDDEPSILEGLTGRVDWTAMNCEVIGSASDRTMGKELLERLRPNLVISNIKIPGPSGMEPVELNYKHGHASRFITLTTYSDFAFAQKTVRCQIEGYILKPVGFQKLEEVVQKAISGIQGMERREQKVRKLERGMKNTQELVTTSLLFNITRCSSDPVDWKQGFLKNYMMFRQGIFLFVKLYNRSKEREAGSLGNIQNEIVRRFLGQGTIILWGSTDDKLIFLCQIRTGVDTETARKRIIDLAGRIMREIGAEEKMICTSVVSGVYRTKEELNDRYREGVERLKESFFAVRSGVFVEMLPTEEPMEVALGGLLHHLKYGNLRKMSEEYLALCKALRRTKGADYAAHVQKELYRQTAKAASDAGMVHKPTMEQQYLTADYDQLSRVLGSYLNATCQYVGNGQNLIGKVKLLVEECYDNSQFELSTAADRLGVNNSYLSGLFKKETNEDFADYLVDVRVGKAEYLLKTTKLKNSEVSAMMGFEDERYFGKVFKKKCGVTPKQYRENIT